MTDQNFDIQDDLVVDDDYKEVATGPKPPLPGNYTFKSSKWDFRRTADGELMLWKNSNGDPTYPLLGLTTVEITEPFENGRKVVIFQDIATSPRDREGARASQAADLLRAFDATAQATNTGDVIRQLTSLLNDGSTFRARLDYAGYDKVFADSTIAAAGGKTNLTKPEINEIYKKAKIQGYKRIKAANAAAGKKNTPLHKWVGPSGNVIEVRPTLTVFYPASEENVILGVDKAVLQLLQ